MYEPTQVLGLNLTWTNVEQAHKSVGKTENHCQVPENYEWRRGIWSNYHSKCFEKLADNLVQGWDGKGEREASQGATAGSLPQAVLHPGTKVGWGEKEKKKRKISWQRNHCLQKARKNSLNLSKSVAWRNNSSISSKSAFSRGFYRILILLTKQSTCPGCIPELFNIKRQPRTCPTVNGKDNQQVKILMWFTWELPHTHKKPIPHVSSLEVTPHSNDQQKMNSLKNQQFFLDPWKRRMQGKLLFLGLQSQVKARNHGLGKQSLKRGNYCIS